MIALNSNCDDVGGAVLHVGCAAGSKQERWLRADLAAHPTACTLAYWHDPRFSSGHGHDNPDMEPLWKDLYDAGAELVLSGHSHDYERFAPIGPMVCWTRPMASASSWSARAAPSSLGFSLTT